MVRARWLGHGDLKAMDAKVQHVWSVAVHLCSMWLFVWFCFGGVVCFCLPLFCLVLFWGSSLFLFAFVLFGFVLGE